jgi:hypothetical protein
MMVAACAAMEAHRERPATLAVAKRDFRMIVVPTLRKEKEERTLGSPYGFLQGAWPFELMEAGWGGGRCGAEKWIDYFSSVAAGVF